MSQAASLLHVHLGQQARGAGIVVEDQPQPDMRVYMLNVMPPGLGPLGSGYFNIRFRYYNNIIINYDNHNDFDYDTHTAYS